MNASQSLFEFLSFRLQNHKRDCVFWMYLIFVVCGVGAAGIWANVLPALIAWDRSKFVTSNFSIAILTFFPSLLVSSCADILLPDKVSRPVKMMSVVLIGFALLWMMLCANLSSKASIFFGAFGCVIGILTWIIAHGEDPVFNDGDEDKADKPTGGPVSRPVAGSEGEFAV